MGEQNDTAVALWSPRFWPTWFGLGLLRLLLMLPYRQQMRVGRFFGRSARLLARRERRIAEINLQLCFADLSPAERYRLLKLHFESLGCALFDTALSWWGSRERILALSRIEGDEHLQKALASGHGVILLGAHFTALEMGARMLSLHTSLAAMYQKPRNAVLASCFCGSHATQNVRKIPSDCVRQLLQVLRTNMPVWFAPDQREYCRSSVLAPFFGHAVLCNTSPSRIAELSGAVVLPYFVERLPDGSGYLARIAEPLENFPSGDAQADAARLQALVETQVRQCPQQYLWTYKRFKHPGYDPYKR